VNITLKILEFGVGMIEQTGCVIVLESNVRIENFLFTDADIPSASVEAMKWAIKRLADQIKIIENNNLRFNGISCDCHEMAVTMLFKQVKDID
jgi:hypothetical protein